jgi:hypothetical protein
MNIYLSDVRYEKLRTVAAEHGYSISRGPKSQIGEFIESLLDLDPIKDYNSIFDGLNSIGLEIASDVRDNSTWHYRWLRGKIVRGFTTPEAALIAAIQERTK